MKYIQSTYENHIAIVTIQNPKALNALSTAVLSDMEEIFLEIQQKKDIYCVILTGEGEKSFVAGADIAEMKEKTVDEAKEYGAFGNRVFRLIETLHCPVIAAINGFALGGGCELAMACDIRIASENAVFAQPEVGLGITPGFGGTQRLMRLIPQGIAKEMIYSGKMVKAQRAYEIGLVNAVYPLTDLMEEAKKLANTIAQQAPIAVEKAKQVMNCGIHLDMDQAIALEVEAFSNCFSTQDQTYGMQCFLDKVKNKTFSNR